MSNTTQAPKTLAENVTVTDVNATVAPDISNLTVEDDEVGFTSRVNGRVGRTPKVNHVLAFVQDAANKQDEKVRKLTVDTEKLAKELAADFKRSIPIVDKTIKTQISQENGKHVVRFQVLNKRILRPRKNKHVAGAVTVTSTSANA